MCVIAWLSALELGKGVEDDEQLGGVEARCRPNGAGRFFPWDLQAMKEFSSRGAGELLPGAVLCC